MSQKLAELQKKSVKSTSAFCSMDRPHVPREFRTRSTQRPCRYTIRKSPESGVGTGAETRRKQDRSSGKDSGRLTPSTVLTTIAG